MNILHLKRLNAQGIDCIEVIIFSIKRLVKRGVIQFTINEKDLLFTATNFPCVIASYPNFAQDSALANAPLPWPRRVS